MKNPLLIALLGIVVTLATPTVTFADNGYKFGNSVNHNNGHNKKHHNNQHHGHNKKYHRHNNKHLAKVKPPKPHHNRHHNYYHNKFNHHKSKPSFSISFNDGHNGITFGNNYSYGYNNYSSYNNNYNYHHNRYNGKSIYQRQDKQARRIRRGIKKGQLVRKEARRLREEQRQIQHKIAYYKRDGRLNRRERSRLHRLLDVASDNIHNKRHNRLTRDSIHHQYNYAWY